MIQLTERERDILTQIVDTWDDVDLPLSGDHSYGEVVELLIKLGVKMPIRLAQIVRECKRKKQ